MSLFPKPKKPPPPPNTPTKADESIINAGELANSGYESLINTGPGGLKTKASGSKRSLIGGA